jgi:membrane associated rhomboid family serine protease
MLALFAIHQQYGTRFALELPLAERPWTLVTATYAHYAPLHLLTNVLLLTLLGIGIERVTSPARFHTFFVATGVFTNLCELTYRAVVGTSAPIVGASGAILACFGYAAVANPVVHRFVDGLDAPVGLELAVGLLVASLTVVVGAGPRIAVVAHFVGLSVGLIAGRRRLLHTASGDGPVQFV